MVFGFEESKFIGEIEIYINLFGIMYIEKCS